MRLSKYIKYVSSLDVAYRSTDVGNPLRIPKIKRSIYKLTSSNSYQVSAAALLFKVSSCLSSPKVQISVDQEASSLFTGARSLEKKISYGIACGSKLTIDFFRFNYADISSKSHIIKTKIKETRKTKLISVQVSSSALSAYRHLSKQSNLSTKTEALVIVNDNSKNADMLISNFTPIVCAGKKSVKFNNYREILQDSK